MNSQRIKTALGTLAVAGALAGATVGLTAAPSGATTSGSVSGYVFAWRQLKATPRTVLVAYRAKNNSTGAVSSAQCSVKAKPTVKMARPGYYSFAPQKFSLPQTTSKFTFIGIFTVPKHFTVSKMWVVCS